MRCLYYVHYVRRFKDAIPSQYTIQHNIINSEQVLTACMLSSGGSCWWAAQAGTDLLDIPYALVLCTCIVGYAATHIES
jgi:hypothetical protein